MLPNLRSTGIYNALVQTQLPAIRRDAQHIVLAGVHGAGMYFLRPLGQLLHQGLLVLKMRNVAGLSTAEAQKSTDMFTKCRYLDEITGGRGSIWPSMIFFWRS